MTLEIPAIVDDAPVDRSVAVVKKRWKPKTLLQAMCTGAAVRTPRWSQKAKRRKLMPPPQRGVTKVRAIAALWRRCEGCHQVPFTQGHRFSCVYGGKNQLQFSATLSV